MKNNDTILKQTENEKTLDSSSENKTQKKTRSKKSDVTESKKKTTKKVTMTDDSTVEVKKEEKSFKDYYYTHEDVMRILNIERTKSYEIIKKLNKELENMKYFTISGQIVKTYFNKRFGLEEVEYRKVS